MDYANSVYMHHTVISKIVAIMIWIHALIKINRVNFGYYKRSEASFNGNDYNNFNFNI